MIKSKKELHGLHFISNVTIDNGLGLKLVLSSYGASIYECYLNDVKITESPSYKEFLSSLCYYGKTAGRTAGRIKNGLVTIDGKKYRLAHKKIHSLHGGKGFSFRNYKTMIKDKEDEIVVKFIHISRDMDQGYPGQLANEIIYRLSKKENSFTIDLKARSKKDTICNLTNHTYWNLNGDRGSILKHRVFIDAEEYVKIDNNLLKIGVEKVNDTFDFRKEKEIGSNLFDNEIQEIAMGYDHDWIISSSKSSPQLVVTGDKSHIRMEVYTSNPVCHIYTNNYAKEDEKYNSMAIEMQKRVFDVEKGAIDLKKNELYHEFIKYRFIEEK